MWRELGDGKWRKQKDLKMDGRRVRKICSDYAGHFISCNQKGYRLTRFATTEEIQHSINDLRSRSRKMIKRAEMLDQALFDREQTGMEV